MGVKAITGATAAVMAFALDHAPFLTAGLVYVGLALTVGLVSRRAKRGLAAVVAGEA